MVGSISSAGLSSLQQASERLDSVLMRMAQGDLDSLPEDVTELSMAKTQVGLGIQMLRIANETTRSLLDIIA